jgi:hypothetical protein
MIAEELLQGERLLHHDQTLDQRRKPANLGEDVSGRTQTRIC